MPLLYSRLVQETPTSGFFQIYVLFSYLLPSTHSTGFAQFTASSSSEICTKIFLSLRFKCTIIFALKQKIVWRLAQTCEFIQMRVKLAKRLGSACGPSMYEVAYERTPGLKAGMNSNSMQKIHRDCFELSVGDWLVDLLGCWLFGQWCYVLSL